MIDDKEVLEWNITIALYKAFTEQLTQLTGKPKRDSKVIFNRTKRHCDALLKVIEEIGDEERLEEITGKIEDSIHELRKSIEQKTPV